MDPSVSSTASTNTASQPTEGFEQNWSFVATLAQIYTLNIGTIPEGCDQIPSLSGISGFYRCRHFSGVGGQQQSGSSVVWDLPNGLNGYM